MYTRRIAPLCLVAAMLPLEAGEIAAWEATATGVFTAIPPVTYTETISTIPSPPSPFWTLRESLSCAERVVPGCPFGTLTFEVPRISLPRGANVLSAELFRVFAYNLNVSEPVISVVPIDSSGPAVASTGLDHHEGAISRADNPVAINFFTESETNGHLLGLGTPEDYTERVVAALASDGQLPPETIGVFLFYNAYGESDIIPGSNSVTTWTQSFSWTGSIPEARLSIVYELADVPEPAPAASLIIGSALLLVVRAWRSRRRSRLLLRASRIFLARPTSAASNGHRVSTISVHRRALSQAESHSE